MHIYKLYNKIFKNDKMDDLYKRIFIRLVNIIIPFYYYFSAIFFKKKLNENRHLNDSDSYIVTLTSFPTRIDKVWLTIESILRQKNKPDAIILWLYEGEFSGRESLPKTLLKQEKRGLQIRFCKENLKPHKKYYYTLAKYPKANIITIDDDFIYPPNFIDDLKKSNYCFPNAICCAMAMEIKRENSQLRPFKEWKVVTKSTEPSKIYSILSGGGTLFPPNSLDNEVFNIEVLKKYALSADDLWLKVHSIRKGTKVVCIAGKYKRTFIPIIIKNNRRLMDINIAEGQNDRVLEDLFNYYDINVSIFDENSSYLTRVN